tara:strand:- start:1485 stop:2798 length:1314 start_codon:yes stop_codon:yes gene_type:complete
MDSNVLESNDAYPRVRQLDCGEVTIRFAENYDFIWDERGNGGKKCVSLCRPLPTNCDNEEGFYSLCSVAVKDHWQVTDCFFHGVAGILIKQNYVPEGQQPALAHPIDYEWRWDSVNSGATVEGSIWRPIPPKGYVALGDVARNQYGSDAKPDVREVMCVREDLTADGILDGNTFIWDDAGSHGDHDVSLWEIRPDQRVEGDNTIFVASGGFVAARKHSKPNRPYRDTVLRVLKLPIFPVDGGEIPVPDVSGYDEPPKTEHMLKSYFYVPCTALTADKDMSRERQFRESPFYRLERHVKYSPCDGFYNNKAPTPISLTITTESGVTKAKSETLSAGASLTVTAEGGCKFIGGTVTCELSASFGWERTKSEEIFASKTREEGYTVPAWSAMGIYFLDEVIYVKRGDGSDFANNRLSFTNASAKEVVCWEDPAHKDDKSE